MFRGPTTVLNQTLDLIRVYFVYFRHYVCLCRPGTHNVSFLLQYNSTKKNCKDQILPFTYINSPFKKKVKKVAKKIWGNKIFLVSYIQIRKPPTKSLSRVRSRLMFIYAPSVNRKLEALRLTGIFFIVMNFSREQIEALDNLHLQYAFTQILVLWGVLYNEMEKRGLFINPEK